MQKVLFLVILTSLFATDNEPKLVKTKITTDITVSIPNNFVPMGDLDFSQRYPSVRKPLGAYTHPNRDADFSVNISATRWPDSDLEIAQQFFRSSVINMFDGVDMINEGIHEVNGKQYIYFEFESRVRGDRSALDLREAVLNYSYIQYLVEPTRTLVFSFNCPRRNRGDWEETAGKIMKSIKIK
jgi:hypothetical protein